ncbi:MAG TPA: aspartate-semialdehyde dehydrogenase, partial [Nitrososphaeraceae archaeon]|nr:aspartate-semialdehyde dehydrogenase [Nitrososphaeraceae archaeon]
MLKVAVIGATGAVGQEFVIGLSKHPWFELVQIASSERSAGKKYVDALRDPATSLLKWHNKENIPENVREMVLSKVDEIDPKKVDL